MPKTIAEMRQSTKVGVPCRSYSLCLAGSLLAEMQSLTNELMSITASAAVDQDGDRQKKKRMNDPSAIRAATIRSRMEELDAEMSEHTGELWLKGVDDWESWVDKNPPREEGQPGFERDVRTTYGICNGDALLADMRRYADTWNGDAIGDEDWEFIRSNAAKGDLKAIAQTIVVMHEQAVDLPKLRQLWREGMTSEND